MIKYITIDKHGRIWGYSDKPFLAVYEVPGVGEYETWDANEETTMTLIGYDAPPENWRDTLARLH